MLVNLNQRITKEKSKRLFYALYPDKNERFGTTGRYLHARPNDSSARYLAV